MYIWKKAFLLLGYDFLTEAKRTQNVLFIWWSTMVSFNFLKIYFWNFSVILNLIRWWNFWNFSLVNFANNNISPVETFPHFIVFCCASILWNIRKKLKVSFDFCSVCIKLKWSSHEHPDLGDLRVPECTETKRKNKR